MKCPKCGFEQPGQNPECPKCGVIFDKYLKFIGNGSSLSSMKNKTPVISDAKWEFTKNLVLHVKPETNPLIFGGRALFFSIILIWSVRFILTPMDANYAMDSFWHLVNLPFHEFGHIIFRPLGRLMTSLGGSLSQLFVPLMCFSVFLLKSRDTFAAAFALWWFGENFMDLAPYIDDASSLTLPLVGGNTGRTSPYGFHDWEFILKELGLAKYGHVLAHAADKLGSLLMICALVWGGYLLYKQYKNLKP
jgi:hypothetical protein